MTFEGHLRGAVGGISLPFDEFLSPPSIREGGEIQIGSIFLQVTPGDITEEATDAIVNGTNGGLQTFRSI